MTIPIEIIVILISICATILIAIVGFGYKVLDNNTKAVNKLTTFITVLEQEFKDNKSLCTLKHNVIDRDISELKEFCKNCNKK